MFSSTAKKKLLFFIPALIIIVLFSCFFILQTYFRPFQFTEDMGVEVNYKKRVAVNSRDLFFPSLIRYKSGMVKFLNSQKDDDLIGFRCSDSFLRTNQGIYILENLKTNTKDKRRVKNQAFLEFMLKKEKDLPKGKKILTVKLCETENKTLLIFYSLGSYESKSADNTPITQTLFNSVNNEAFLQIVTAGNFLLSDTFTITRSAGYLRCDKPFQLGAGSLLYLLCDEQLSKSASYFIYELNLNTGKNRILGSCLNNFAAELKTDCH